MKDHSKEDTFHFLAGGGEMGERIRAMDWSTNPAGPISEWPKTLRSMVSMILSNSFPIVIWWGPEYVQIYNDTYIPILGNRHPSGLGQPCREAWPEVWQLVKPIFDKIHATGEPIEIENQHFPVMRYGFLEEVYATTAYSPLRGEDGEIEGILVLITETTEKVLGQRRLQTLRDLASRSYEARTPDEAGIIAAENLSNNSHDIPFALIYLADKSGKQARLIDTVGLERGTKPAPEQVNLEADQPGTWPLYQVYNTGEAEELDKLESKFGALPGGAWPEAPETALILPITSSGKKGPGGMLVVGISARRKLDDDYRQFLQLVTAQVASAIGNAVAYQEQRAKAEMLAELDHAKTTFFSNISHEFRTPLTLMLAPLEELLGTGKLTPDSHNKVELAHRNAVRLQQLVNALLDFSRLEAGRTEASFEPVDLSAFTAELASMFHPVMEKARLDFIIDCPMLSSEVYVDREMWEKIVLNLLSNAFKFTFEGQVEISMNEDADSAVLSVRDTGTGIAEEEIPNLFKRFYRIENVRSRTYEGSGIGLSLVKELVDLHGGRIDVKSKVNEGTTFTISIPFGNAHLPEYHIQTAKSRSSTAVDARAYANEAMGWLKDEIPVSQEVMRGEEISTAPGVKQPLRILLVDDNADMREYLKRLLSERWDVLAVHDGAEALREVKRQIPDLVLSDVMMPGMSGFDLLKALRKDEETSRVPVILISARAGEEATLEGLEKGADDYLVKPFSSRELMARIHTHLSLAHLRTNNSRLLKMNELMDSFVHIAAHDLKSPVANLKLLASVLNSAESHQEKSKYLEKIDPLVERLDGTINGLVQAIEIQSAGHNPEQVDFEELLEEIKEDLNEQLKESEATLTWDFEAWPSINYVRLFLNNIIRNLVSNAIKNKKQHEPLKIQLKARKSEEFVLLTADDNGTGIDLEQVGTKLFQPFARISNGKPGKGVGLFLIKNMVEKNGGFIEVESHLGKGTRFLVYLKGY